MTTIHVVTEVPPRGGRGNLATAIGEVFLDPQATGGSFEDQPKPLGEALGAPLLDIYVQVPVFKLGEILVLDHNDRDQFSRKPSKWSITVEAFDTIEEAVVRARVVAGDV